LLSPIHDLPINYGKYTEYLKPMLDDLQATPRWVAEDLARPELNLLQNDLLDQQILYCTGRTGLDTTLSQIDMESGRILHAYGPGGTEPDQP
jgi:hypothetical protein